MLTKEELPECPVATTVSLIGSKWKLLIIRNLLERPWRFNELKKNLEGISQKVLTDSLRSMENDGLIIRTVYPEVPPRVEYSLSELGLTLKPILDSMVEWGNAYKKCRKKFSGRKRKAPLKRCLSSVFPYAIDMDSCEALSLLHGHFYGFIYAIVGENVNGTGSFFKGLDLAGLGYGRDAAVACVIAEYVGVQQQLFPAARLLHFTLELEGLAFP